MTSIIQTPTPNLNTSIEFYEKLNFKILSKSPTIVTDGKILIEINPDRLARAGMKLYRESWDLTVSKLEQITEVHHTKEGYLFGDGTGTWVYLIENQAPAAANAFKVKENFGILGNAAGLSLESSDMNYAAKIWQILGFRKTAGDFSQGWISFENNDGMTVSLMKPGSCPHLFFNPSLSYFNGKEENPKVISKIRKLSIPITEEITVFNEEEIVDNIIIRDPGGLGFFIFND